jgi:hypothetical protein
VTFVSFPPDAVTVMPFDGSAFAPPVPGVIITAGPAARGALLGADADADAPEAPLSFPAGLLFPAELMVLVAFPVHAASASAVTAAPASSPIALMFTPFPPQWRWEPGHFP